MLYARAVDRPKLQPRVCLLRAQLVRKLLRTHRHLRARIDQDLLLRVVVLVFRHCAHFSHIVALLRVQGHKPIVVLNFDRLDVFLLLAQLCDLLWF